MWTKIFITYVIINVLLANSYLKKEFKDFGEKFEVDGEYYLIAYFLLLMIILNLSVPTAIYKFYKQKRKNKLNG